MDEDDLPPKKRDRDGGFAGALGWTVGSFVWVALFVALAGAVLFVVTHWL